MPVAAEAETNPLSRKLEKVLSLNINQSENPDLVLALKNVSGLIKCNNLRTRRSLRGDLERRSVQLSETLVDQFRNVHDLMETLHSEVSSMYVSCNELSTELSTARSQMQGLLEKTSKIRRESVQVEIKKEMVDVLQSRFYITPSEMSLLGRSDPLEPSLYKVLQRVKQVHEDSKALIQTDQGTALRIMDQMSTLQDTAFHTLHKWSMGECRRMTGDLPEASGVCKEALSTLAERPALFSACLGEVTKTRRAAILRMFINSLTKGSGGKAIELSSHDPVRYCGDLLAWLHQNIATERDFLVNLLPPSGDISTALTTVVEGLCRTVQVRVDQIISHTGDCITLLNISNIIVFYTSTIEPLTSDKCELVILLKDLNKRCMEQFHSQYQTNITKLTERQDLPLEDLVPTEATQEAVYLLREVLNTISSSVATETQNKSQIFDGVVDPIVGMCSIIATQLDPTKEMIYRVNVLSTLHDLLSTYPDTDGKLESLQTKVAQELETITNLQYDHILKKISVPAPGECTPERLRQVQARLSDGLCASEMLWLPVCTRLTSLKHRNTVWQGATGQFLHLYTSLWQQPGGVLTKTPDQIRQLLI